MLTALNLYAVRVGNTGSFFAAAVDMHQAHAVAEQWRHDKGISSSTRITVKRHSDSRPVLTFAR